jgi:hypothetical protein
VKTAALARALREFDWFGAKLARSTTALAFAESLVRAYPDLDHPQIAAQAQAWLIANPDKRKKQLGKFLNGWFNRAANPERFRVPSQSELPLNTEAGRAAARKRAGWDDTPNIKSFEEFMAEEKEER